MQLQWESTALLLRAAAAVGGARALGSGSDGPTLHGPLPPDTLDALYLQQPAACVAFAVVPTLLVTCASPQSAFCILSCRAVASRCVPSR
eukprot:1309460-Prymnesium_polylepis.1